MDDVLKKTIKPVYLNSCSVPGTVLGTRCHEILTIVGVLAEFYKSVSSEEWQVNNAVFQSRQHAAVTPAQPCLRSWAAFSVTPLAKASGD